ncbi:MAG: ABC transporter ATP-binding protein, partial [Candidatus Bathyarchaeota archaeon]
VAVMYAGKIVEMGPVDEIYGEPQHPYTKFLISSLPKIGDKEKKGSISGKPPSLVKPPAGCRFNPRCPFMMEVCKVEEPVLKEVRPDHHAACHLLG